jgi:hypothetical protein
MDLIDALTVAGHVESPVALSEEAPFRRKFSIIYDTLRHAEIDLDGLAETLLAFQPEDSETIAGHEIYGLDATPNERQEAEAFGKLTWATGCTRQADLVPELIFVCDGAVWIWKLVEFYYPTTIQIVDWDHAEDHLKNLSLIAFASEVKRTVWLEEVTQDLWDGQVPAVIAACERLATRYSEARTEATYFSHNQESMRYDQFRSAGHMIGSGTVESGCKQIVT